MLKKIFIAGIKGNMGARYALICKELGAEVFGGTEAISLTQQAITAYNRGCDGIIIATPTATHLDALNLFQCFNEDTPILVEKPLVRAVPNEDVFLNIRMVNQYEYLIDKDSVGPTYYNYYKHGADGLYWDCINIIGLAKGAVTIKNDSFRWQCMINGKNLSIADMDNAYFTMIKTWLEKPEPNIEYQIQAHKKVMELIKENTPQGKKQVVQCKTKVIPMLSHE